MPPHERADCLEERHIQQEAFARQLESLLDDPAFSEVSAAASYVIATVLALDDFRKVPSQVPSRVPSQALSQVPTQASIGL